MLPTNKPKINIHMLDFKLALQTANNAVDASRLASELHKEIMEKICTHTTSKDVTVSDIWQIKKDIPRGAVIMAHDKNPGELTEECPYRYYMRMKKELYDLATDNRLHQRSFRKYKT